MLVLVFGMTANPGGVESVIMNYYRNIDRNKIDFEFLCTSDTIAYENEIIQSGGRIYKIVARKENPIRFRIQLHRFMKENAKRYDAIWVNLCSLVNIDYLIEARRFSIPRRIIHCHNADNDAGWVKMIIHNFNKARLSKYATDYWTCSNEASKWFYSETIIRGSRYHIIYNGIDIEKYSYDADTRIKMRKKLCVEDKIVIGHVGRFHFQKNHRFLLDVFNMGFGRLDQFHLILIGQGDLEPEIRALVHAKGLNGKVTFCGVHENVEDYYQAMDVFVLPSVFEGLGIVALEAQANGLPCLLSDKVPHEVKINENVCFLSIENPALWVKKINEFVELGHLPQMHNKMEKSKFNIKRTTEQFICYMEAQD